VGRKWDRPLKPAGTADRYAWFLTEPEQAGFSLPLNIVAQPHFRLLLGFFQFLTQVIFSPGIFKLYLH
jgi:hypothetical protein